MMHNVVQWFLIFSGCCVILFPAGTYGQVPVISEFLTGNGSSMPLEDGELLDEDGDSSDWIELFNPTTRAVNLEGWYLTDDADDLSQWQFPAVSLPGGQFLVVFASGKDRRNPGQTLHTNFRLGQGEGGFLALIQPDGQTATSLYSYSDQLPDVSYGLLDMDSIRRDHNEGFMSPPTPGRENRAGAFDFVRDVRFSVERGFYDEMFPLTLTTETSGADIRYSLDGSTPTATHGQRYVMPLTVDSTTVIRAAAFKPGYLDTEVGTQTYLFVRDVVVQSPQGQAPGPDWPKGSVNGQILDYGMDPAVVNDPRWADVMEQALLDIPTFSLVTDIDHLFGRSKGIYVNARRDGRDWERRTSVELIHPDGSLGFSQDAGLRIRGAFSRSGNNPKHAFRLIFRREYGAGKLDYPLFGGEGAQAFDKIDLRTSQNNSWSFGGSSQNTLIRDVFSRDVQRDMGQPYTRSRYYHLYLNGHYWGIYQTEERADADFAESYLGANAEDYDVIKNDSSGSRALHATAGTIDAYRRLYDAAVAGFHTDAAYRAVLGLHPDGTPDPAGERLLDPENLMDYMICTYYTGDPDAPVSCWAHFSNNIFAIYNHAQPQGFSWYRHDAEHSLGANGGVNEGRLLTDPVDRMIGQQWRHFNPAWLHVRLCTNEQYRRQFADRVAGYFANGGILTAAPNIERWMARANRIDLAIIAESARWGDAKRSSPRTKVDWQGQNDYMTQTFFPKRTPIVMDQMRSVGMFPQQAVVAFNQPGGDVTAGFELRMQQTDGLPGTLYYTLDGSDPRRDDGSIHGSAMAFMDEILAVTLVPRGATWRYLDNGSDQGADWRGFGFNERIWRRGEAPLGYGDGDETTVVGYGSSSGSKYPTTYFRHTFEAQDISGFTELSLGLVRDDGAVVYLNGVEVIRVNMPGGAIDYRSWASGAGVPVGGADESTLHTFTVNPTLLRQGTNLLAVEIHQVSGTSSDISFDLELIGLISQTASQPIILEQATVVKARVWVENQWGALAEARFTVGLSGLVINEFMAANRTVLEDPAEAGEYPDWIELYHNGPGSIDLEGMFLTDDLQNKTKWPIVGLSIDSDQYLLIYADDDGTQGPDHTNFKLSSQGDSLALIDVDGDTVLDSIVFDRQIDDVSYGRFPDGAATWGYHAKPTPGVVNQGHGP